MIKFGQSGSIVLIQCPYDPRTVGIIKQIPGREWDGLTKTWRIPVGMLRDLVGALEREGIPYDRDSLGSIRVCSLEPREILERLLGGAAVVFDIETYEISPSPAKKVDPALHGVVCASVAFHKDGELLVEQWFAEDKDRERDVLEALSSALRDKLVLTYNGDQFDIPCFNLRCAALGVDFRIRPENHFDLIHVARRWKEEGIIPDARLKTLERSYGIEREDELPGSAVVKLYEQYIESREPEIKAAILRHNYEDVLYLARDLAPRLLRGEKPQPVEAPMAPGADPLLVTSLADEYARWHRLYLEARARRDELRSKLLSMLSGPGLLKGTQATLKVVWEDSINEHMARELLEAHGLLEEYLRVEHRIDAEKFRADVLAGRLPEEFRAALDPLKKIRLA